MPIATVLIIAVTVAVSLSAFNNRALLERLLLWPPAIARQRQYERLLTYGLVHADGMHLLFNMITFFFFGRVMESVLGGMIGLAGYVGFYVGGLLVSILPTYLANRHNAQYRSLGASGAVSAVLFAFILLDPWAMLYVYFLPVPAIVFAVAYLAYTIWSDRRGQDNVNHSAHLWGAVYGVVFMIAVEPRVIGHFLRAVTSPDFG